jgi:hypothetical protein
MSSGAGLMKHVRKSLKKSHKRLKKSMKKSKKHLKKSGGKRKSITKKRSVRRKSVTKRKSPAKKRSTTKRRSVRRKSVTKRRSPTKRRSVRRRSVKKGGYTKAQTKKIKEGKERRERLAEALTNTANLKCPKGQIVRNGYITKNGAVVGATCIKNVGKPGKYEGEHIYLKPGLLTKYGYHLDENANKRRNALKKAVKEYGYGSTVKKVNILAVFDKHNNVKDANTARSDVEWLKKHRNELEK